MTDVLLTGATGVLGSELRHQLLDEGYTVRAASRSPPADGEAEWTALDLKEGTGMQEAVEGVDTIVHAASDAQGDHEAVDVGGTRRLVAAAEDADISNILYISIVGIDEIPYSYYEHKLEAERIIESSDLPSTIVRSTQFHPFVAFILGNVARLPMWPLPTKFRLQPIETGEAAERIVEHVAEDAGGEMIEIGGPEILTVRELATTYREARILRRPIVRFPLPGSIASAFRDGEATTPDNAVGTVTWESWLKSQEEIPGRDIY